MKFQILPALLIAAGLATYTQTATAAPIDVLPGSTQQDGAVATQAPAVQVVNPFIRKSAAPPMAAVAVPTPASAPAKSIVKHKKTVTPEKPKVSPPVETWETPTPGPQIGTVNGAHVFRGANGYLFEATTALAITRKPVKPAEPSAQMVPGAALAIPGSNVIGYAPPSPPVSGLPSLNNSGLPSIVGRPTPSAGTLPSMGFGGQSRATPGVGAPAPAAQIPAKQPDATASSASAKTATPVGSPAATPQKNTGAPTASASW